MIQLKQTANAPTPLLMELCSRIATANSNIRTSFTLLATSPQQATDVFAMVQPADAALLNSLWTPPHKKFAWPPRRDRNALATTAPITLP